MSREDIDYKELYERTKKELDDLKSGSNTKDKLVNEIAKIFNENPKTIETYQWEGQTKSYEGFNKFYKELFSRHSKSFLNELIIKINRCRNDGEGVKQ